MMQKTHPTHYKFCIEKLHYDKVLSYINVPYKMDFKQEKLIIATAIPLFAYDKNIQEIANKEHICEFEFPEDGKGGWKLEEKDESRS